jgi:hypothetical protein
VTCTGTVRTVSAVCVSLLPPTVWVSVLVTVSVMSWSTLLCAGGVILKSSSTASRSASVKVLSKLMM